MLAAILDTPLQAGQVISGRFRLERLLGRGGMGTVWEARHLSLETQIAIKFLNADLSRRHDVLARFAREATSAARIRSPHVVGILDSGFTDDGRGFIAMELLRGEDLSRRLARFGRLTVNETSLLVAQVCRGLAKAHSVGVIHRDLKPENIFIVDEDDAFTIKILDFGIAKSIGPEASTHKTDTGQLLGTPLYMSPEQALGRPIDSRSDLYSLAVVAYRCLAGRPPFMYPAVGELIVAVSTHEAPPPSKFNSDLPPSLDAWFVTALHKDPGTRHQNAVELAESFDLACGSARSNLKEPSDLPQARPSWEPLAPSETEDAVLPSREEAATTVAVPPAVPRKKFDRKGALRWVALAFLSVLLVGGAKVALRSQKVSNKTEARELVHALEAARPQATELPAQIAPDPRPSATESPKVGDSRVPPPQPPSKARVMPRKNEASGIDVNALPAPPQPSGQVTAPSASVGSTDPPLAPPAADRTSAAPPAANAKSGRLPIDRGTPW